MQPKLNPIRLEMLKDISKFSRMDTQNTMNKIIDVVYMDPKLKKQIFKKWFVREISQYIKRLTSLTYKVLPKGDKKYLKNRKFFAIFFPTMKKIISRPYPDHQNGGFGVSWNCLTFCFSSEGSHSIKKDLKWYNLKSEESEIELPGRDSNLRPIG